MRRSAGLLLITALACAGEPRPPEIVVTTIAAFGDTAGDGAIAGTPTIARDRAGRYYAVAPSGGAGALVAVYDSTGRFLTRLGRVGDGPGEYRQPNVVTAMGDSMAIFDAGTRRINFIGPSLEWAGSSVAPGPVMSAVAFPNGNFVVNWPLPSGDSARGFFQRYDRKGRYLGSFEEPRAPCDPEACLLGRGVRLPCGSPRRRLGGAHARRARDLAVRFWGPPRAPPCAGGALVSTPPVPGRISA